MGMAVLMSNQTHERFYDACKDILKAVAYVDDTTGEKLRYIVSTAKEGKLTKEDYSEVCISLKKSIEKRIEE